MKRIFKQTFFIAAFLATALFTKQAIFANPILVNETTFPDKNLRKAVKSSLTFAYDEEGNVLKNSKGEKYYESDSCTSIWGEKIGNFKGIELLTKLETITNWSSKATDIDFSQNPKIKSVNIYGKEIKSFKLANNKGLEYLTMTCAPNIKFDLSKYVNLTNLDIYGDCISSFDVTKYPKLTRLSISSNNLKKIDFSKGKKLELISLSSCANLTEVKLGTLNNLTVFYISDCPKIESVDVSKCKNLSILKIADTAVKNVNVKNNPKICRLSVNGNKNLTELDITKNKDLERLNVGATNLKNLNVSKNSKLTDLHVYETKISSLNLKNNKDLYYVSYNGSNIKDLRFDKLYDELFISYYKLKAGDSIDLSKYIGTGYKLEKNWNENAYTYNSAKNIIKTKKIKDVNDASLTLSKGKKKYQIYFSYSY